MQKSSTKVIVLKSKRFYFNEGGQPQVFSCILPSHP